MDVAIGVLTYNALAGMRWELLMRTLKSLRVAFPESKILVLDNRSSDGTAEALGHAILAGDISVDVVSYTAYDELRSPARGRNRLALELRKTDARFWIMSDDDMEWSPASGVKLDYVFASVPIGLTPRTVLVSCILEPEYPWNKTIGKSFVTSPEEPQVVFRESAPAAAWCFPAANWYIIGPLDESMATGEDVDACKRITENGWAVGQVDLARHIGQGYSLLGNDSGREIHARRKT